MIAAEGTINLNFADEEQENNDELGAMDRLRQCECKYDWVLDIREQCKKEKVTFWFKNTGSLFIRDGIAEKVNPFKQTGMAKELDINILNGKRLF